MDMNLVCPRCRYHGGYHAEDCDWIEEQPEPWCVECGSDTPGQHAHWCDEPGRGYDGEGNRDWKLDR